MGKRPVKEKTLGAGTGRERLQPKCTFDLAKRMEQESLQHDSKDLLHKATGSPWTKVREVTFGSVQLVLTPVKSV